MGDYDWAERFRQCWEKAAAAYRTGNRNPAAHFNADEAGFLAGIGCSAQEVYDFAEDSEELSFDTALLITAVRRDYFLVVQQSRPTGCVVTVSDFPPKKAEVAGFAWLPRQIAKARAKLRGEMPAELMYCCGGDRAFFKKVNVHPADFLRVAWAAHDDDQKIIEYVKQCAGKSV